MSRLSSLRFLLALPKFGGFLAFAPLPKDLVARPPNGDETAPAHVTGTPLTTGAGVAAAATSPCAGNATLATNNAPSPSAAEAPKLTIVPTRIAPPLDATQHQ